MGLKELAEVEKMEEIKSFLEDGKPSNQSLGCGINNGVFYFGTKIWKDKKGYTAVVTSDKKIHINKQKKEGKFIIGTDEIKEKFKLDYNLDNDFYYEGLHSFLEKDAIKKWLYEDCSEITFEKIYNKLLKLFKKYLYLDDERKYKLLVLYRIAGYFMFIWKARARLFLWAEMGSGKSRFTQLLHNTGFNSVSLGDWTKSYLQRMVQSTMCEVHLDDFESMPDELKKETERLIKVGYMKGFKAGKTSDNNRRPEVFDLFNTTTINNTEGLDVITSDRCYTITIPKINGTVEGRNFDSEPDFKDPIYKEIRDSLYILALKECNKVAAIYPTIKSNKINGRLLSIAKPELTIAKIISTELFNEIEEWYSQEIKQLDCRDLSNDWEFHAYQAIYQKVIRDNEDWFYLRDVVLEVAEDLYSELYPDQRKKKRHQMSLKLGNTFARSTLFEKGRTGGYVRYKINSKEGFENFLKSKKILTQIDSTNPTNTTNSTNPTNPTNNTKNDLKDYVTEEIVGD